MKALSHKLKLPLWCPPGSRWVRDDDGEWSLVSSAAAAEQPAVGEEEPPEPDAPSIIDHVVAPTDTLQGICLRYGVTRASLRRVNQGCDDLRFHTVLRVPLRTGTRQPLPDVSARERALLRLRTATRLATAECEFYLDEAAGDVERALAAAAADALWEEERARREEAAAAERAAAERTAAECGGAAAAENKSTAAVAATIEMQPTARQWEVAIPSNTERVFPPRPVRVVPTTA